MNLFIIQAGLDLPITVKKQKKKTKKKNKKKRLSNMELNTSKKNKKHSREMFPEYTETTFNKF